MVYLKSVENVITLGKLIGLLFLFCLPLLSILFLKTKRNDLVRPVMGTIFLVNAHLYCHAFITIEVSLRASRSSLPDQFKPGNFFKFPRRKFGNGKEER